MKEVIFWEAEDGTRFESEYRCEKYERHVKCVKLLKIVPCYNDAFMRMNGEDEGFDESDIRYILIPDKITTGFDEALQELDEDFFERQLPYYEIKSHNDLMYWDDDFNGWRVWSKDFENLEIMKNNFQLFGEGE